MSYRPPERLGPTHDLDAFACASAEQTDGLVRHARQSMATGNTRVFVVTPTDRRQVIAYDAWTMAQIALADAPARLRTGAGRYPQPVALLARLGVDRGHERNGLGAALLRDVIQRAAAISDDIGCRGLLVHTESEDARTFDRGRTRQRAHAGKEAPAWGTPSREARAAARAAQTRRGVSGTCRSCRPWSRSASRS